MQIVSDSQNVNSFDLDNLKGNEMNDQEVQAPVEEVIPQKPWREGETPQEVKAPTKEVKE